jgi:protein TonB
VIDAVDRLIADRQAMDRGFSAAAVVSVMGHVVFVVGALAIPALLPHEPLLKVGTMFAVPLPRGGGGPLTTEAPAPAKERAPAVEPPPPDKPAPKIAKPPKEEPRKGLPDPNAKKAPGRKEPQPVQAARSGGAPGATGSSIATPGLGLGLVPGPGIPGGTDISGDWYLASVQRKIWTLWVSQIKPQTPSEAIVSFTIQADGSLTDVRLVQSSGTYRVDYVARSAVETAGPFAPLPKDYGTNRITVQAIFKPMP